MRKGHANCASKPKKQFFCVVRLKKRKTETKPHVTQKCAEAKVLLLVGILSPPEMCVPDLPLPGALIALREAIKSGSSCAPHAESRGLHRVCQLD